MSGFVKGGSENFNQNRLVLVVFVYYHSQTADENMTKYKSAPIGTGLWFSMSAFAKGASENFNQYQLPWYWLCLYTITASRLM